jgi:hypothetical protein
MTRTKFRPGSINSRGLRKAFHHREADPLFSRLFEVADELKATFDGLVAVREAQTPLKTREANAIELRQTAVRTTEIIKRRISELSNNFLDVAERKGELALERAGVRYDPQGGDEVRRALREMGTGAAGDKARTEALQAAVKSGDRIVLAAIRNAPSPITIGGFNLPTDQVIETYVRQENPGFADEMIDLLSAIEHLSILEQSFERGAEDLRDLDGEAAADAGIRLAEAAKQKLQGSLGIELS